MTLLQTLQDHLDTEGVQTEHFANTFTLQT